MDRTRTAVLLFIAAVTVTKLSAQENNQKTTVPKKEIRQTVDRWAFVPEIAAEIDDRKIGKEELIKEVKSQFPLGDVSVMPDDQLKDVSMKILDQYINRIILEKLLKNAGVTPSADMVRAEFQKKLAAMPPEKVGEMEKKLETQGETLQTYEKKMSSDTRLQFAMALEKWSTANLADKQAVSDEEAEAFYRNNQNQFLNPESVTVSHILIRNDIPRNKDGGPAAAPGAPLEKKAENTLEAEDESDRLASLRASKIRDLLLQGENFEKLAAEYSDCPSGKKAGGSLGTIPRGKMIKEFEQTAFELAPGQISGIVKTRYGYHIIMVKAKNKQGYVPFPNVKQLIKDLLSEQKTKEAITRKIESEKKHIKIKINI